MRAWMCAAAWWACALAGAAQAGGEAAAPGRGIVVLIGDRGCAAAIATRR